jgi:hypothetical protein
MMVGLLFVQIIVVATMGIEPCKRRLEEMSGRSVSNELISAEPKVGIA